MLPTEEKSKRGRALGTGTQGFAATVSCASRGLMGDKDHAREGSAWRKMIPLASYLWLCVTTSLAFFLRFLSRRVFRPRKDHESCNENCSSSALAASLALVSEADKCTEEEKETSVLQFRFGFQIPEQNDVGTNRNRETKGGSVGEVGGSATTTSVSNYRFSSEGDYRGFVEAPQAVTLCVQESYIGSNGLVWGSSEELDRELKGGLPSANCSRQVDSDVGVADELDWVLESMSLPAKISGWQYNPDAGITDRKVREKQKRMYADNLSRAASLKQLELLDVDLPDEVAYVPAGPRFLPAADFSGFRSDSESDISSDGYSVKDLVLDLDSDGFFSERELETEIGKASLSESDGEEKEILERELKSEAAQWLNSPGSVGKREKFDEANVELTESIKNGTEINLDKQEALERDQKYEAAQLANSPGSAGNTEFFYGENVELTESIKNGTEISLDKEEILEREQKSEATQLLNSPGFVGNTQNFDGANVESTKSIKNGREVNLNNLNNSVAGLCYTNPINSPYVHDDVMANAYLYAADTEAEQVRREEMDQKEALDDSNDVNGEEAGVAASSTGLSRTVSSLDDAALSEVNSEELEQGQDGNPQGSKETHLRESEKTEEPSVEEEMEDMWEHDDLIDQLRTELRKARATGLPTISEESESLRSADDLKPWKLEARFLKEDPMQELHKLYKIYRERMKKLDVLNHQKMFAIGFLQLKDPLQCMGTQKLSLPTIASIVSQNIWLRCRRRSSTADHPSERFIKELQCDLEMVYVGHSCLSWEFLRWQYERTQELLKSDPHDSHRYNQVAGEFQQFQVLIQRFLENEPFQEPRVPNYVKNRCVLRNLVQVPVIREDCLKNKVKVDGKMQMKGAINGEQLEYIMEDSIRIFWEFVKKDKDETPLIIKGLVATHVELQDPTDRELMMDIQAILKQKQKKLKDLIKTSNCLVKKFKKSRQGTSNQDNLFFSQLDLKLVSRVLKMPRITTDQLVWCHKKLSKITFLDRKLLREPSFLLFPC